MSNSACVYLVGAGSGDPDLLTIKGHRLLQEADVVIYDRLVSDAILQQIPKGVSKIFVGKAPDNHTLSQDEINHLLLNLAGKSRIIVRLKGGDPFVFGRGGEEAMFLVEHNIRFEVVPGVTAAIAASTYAGIPLTHRGLAQNVQIITGHRQNHQPLDLDWKKLVNPLTTLVVYMGLATIDEISQQLMQAGLSGDTPVAAIENGATPEQRRLITSLMDVTRDVSQHEFKPPTLFVIGEVVRLADTLDWYDKESGDNSSDTQNNHAQA